MCESLTRFEIRLRSPADPAPRQKDLRLLCTPPIAQNWASELAAIPASVTTLEFDGTFHAADDADRAHARIALEEARVRAARLVGGVCRPHPADREYVAQAVLRDRDRVHARAVCDRHAGLVASLHQRKEEWDVQTGGAHVHPRHTARAHKAGKDVV